MSHQNRRVDRESEKHKAGVKERNHDATIWPLIDQIFELAEVEDIGFTISFFLDNGLACTSVRSTTRTPTTIMLEMAKRLLAPEGGLDELLRFVLVNARRYGHESDVLESLGIPREPDKSVREKFRFEHPKPNGKPS
jgi:hypothetical protein